MSSIDNKNGPRPGAKRKFEADKSEDSRLGPTKSSKLSKSNDAVGASVDTFHLERLPAELIHQVVKKIDHRHDRLTFRSTSRAMQGIAHFEHDALKDEIYNHAADAYLKGAVLTHEARVNMRAATRLEVDLRDDPKGVLERAAYLLGETTSVEDLVLSVREAPLDGFFLIHNESITASLARGIAQQKNLKSVQLSGASWAETEVMRPIAGALQQAPNLESCSFDSVAFDAMMPFLPLMHRLQELQLSVESDMFSTIKTLETLLPEMKGMKLLSFTREVGFKEAWQIFSSPVVCKVLASLRCASYLDLSQDKDFLRAKLQPLPVLRELKIIALTMAQDVITGLAAVIKQAPALESFHFFSDVYGADASHVFNVLALAPKTLIDVHLDVEGGLDSDADMNCLIASLKKHQGLQAVDIRSFLHSGFEGRMAELGTILAGMKDLTSLTLESDNASYWLWPETSANPPLPLFAKLKNFTVICLDDQVQGPAIVDWVRRMPNLEQFECKSEGHGIILDALTLPHLQSLRLIADCSAAELAKFCARHVALNSLHLASDDESRFFKKVDASSNAIKPHVIAVKHLFLEGLSFKMLDEFKNLQFPYLTRLEFSDYLGSELAVSLRPVFADLLLASPKLKFIRFSGNAYYAPSEEFQEMVRSVCAEINHQPISHERDDLPS